MARGPWYIHVYQYITKSTCKQRNYRTIAGLECFDTFGGSPKGLHMSGVFGAGFLDSVDSILGALGSIPLPGPSG